MLHQFESLSARLEGRYARPVAAFLVAGSLMGFVVGQQLGHAHPTTLRHHASRPAISATTTPRHTPIAPPGPTPTPIPTTSHVANPVVSYNPPAAQPPGNNNGNSDDGGGGDHGGHGDDGGGHGGHGGHGGGGGHGGHGGGGGHGGHGHHGGHAASN